MQLLTISSQRQITLPKAFLDKLSVNKKDKLMGSVVNNKIVFEAVGESLVEELAGSLNSYVAKKQQQTSDSTILKQTKKIVAKKLAEKQ